MESIKENKFSKLQQSEMNKIEGGRWRHVSTVDKAGCTAKIYQEYKFFGIFATSNTKAEYSDD